MDIELDLNELVGPREKALKSNKYWRRTMEIEILQAVEDAGFDCGKVALVYLPGNHIPARKAYHDNGSWTGASRAQYGARHFNDRISFAGYDRPIFLRLRYVEAARRSRLSQSFMKSRLP